MKVCGWLLTFRYTVHWGEASAGNLNARRVQCFELEGQRRETGLAVKMQRRLLLVAV